MRAARCVMLEDRRGIADSGVVGEERRSSDDPRVLWYRVDEWETRPAKLIGGYPPALSAFTSSMPAVSSLRRSTVERPSSERVLKAVL